METQLLRQRRPCVVRSLIRKIGKMVTNRLQLKSLCAGVKEMHKMAVFNKVLFNKYTDQLSSSKCF